MMLIGVNTMGYTEATNHNDYKILPIMTTQITVDSSKVLNNTNLSDTNAINAFSQKHDVVYTCANGNKFVRSGGSRAWRNNNPGCLRYSDFTVSQGAIGEAGGFAVFPDEETGMKAISVLLKSDKYNKLTISQAISKYAPPHENDTSSYNNNLRKITGLPITKKLIDLDEDQVTNVVKAIRIIEGWHIGNENQITKETSVTDSLDFYAVLKQQNLKKNLQKTI